MKLGRWRWGDELGAVAALAFALGLGVGAGAAVLAGLWLDDRGGEAAEAEVIRPRPRPADLAGRP